MNRVDEFHNHHLNLNLKKKRTNKLQGKRSHKNFKHKYQLNDENSNKIYEDLMIGQKHHSVHYNEKGSLSI